MIILNKKGERKKRLTDKEKAIAKSDLIVLRNSRGSKIGLIKRNAVNRYWEYENTRQII